MGEIDPRLALPTTYVSPMWDREEGGGGGGVVAYKQTNVERPSFVGEVSRFLLIGVRWGAICSWFIMITASSMQVYGRLWVGVGDVE